MPRDITTDSLRELFTFPFQGEEWKQKLTIGALITDLTTPLFIVAPIFLNGYTVRIMRRIIHEDGEPFLPEWDDWETLIKDGLKLSVITYVTMVPTLLFALVNGVLIVGLSIIQSGEITSPELFRGLEDLTTFIPAGSLFLFGLNGGGFVLLIFISLIMPPIFGHVVATNELGAALRVREWWGIFRANLFGYFMAYLLVYITGMVFAFVIQGIYMTIVLCCLLPVIMGAYSFYISLISSTLYAQAYRDGVQRLAQDGATALTESG